MNLSVSFVKNDKAYPCAFQQPRCVHAGFYVSLMEALLSYVSSNLTLEVVEASAYDNLAIYDKAYTGNDNTTMGLLARGVIDISGPWFYLLEYRMEKFAYSVPLLYDQLVVTYRTKQRVNTGLQSFSRFDTPSSICIFASIAACCLQRLLVTLFVRQHPELKKDAKHYWLPFYIVFSVFLSFMAGQLTLYFNIPMHSQWRSQDGAGGTGGWGSAPAGSGRSPSGVVAEPQRSLGRRRSGACGGAPTVGAAPRPWLRQCQFPYPSRICANWCN